MFRLGTQIETRGVRDVELIERERPASTTELTPRSKAKQLWPEEGTEVLADSCPRGPHSTGVFRLGPFVTAARILRSTRGVHTHVAPAGTSVITTHVRTDTRASSPIVTGPRTAS